MRVFTVIEELAGAVGEVLGTSAWLEVDQARVDAFADATGDHQWIHVDPERAASGPFGGTVAHGYLTLSLIPMLGEGVLTLDTPGAKLNYGVNKVRFPSPLRVGKRIRVTISVVELTELPAGHQLTLRHVVEIEDEAKPACVAETVVLLLVG